MFYALFSVSFLASKNGSFFLYQLPPYLIFTFSSMSQFWQGKQFCLSFSISSISIFHAFFHVPFLARESFLLNFLSSYLFLSHFKPGIQIGTYAHDEYNWMEGEFHKLHMVQITLVLISQGPSIINS